MIAQYAAAALVNEIKVLAHPASVDSIPTSAGMEDFVSMGATAAIKLQQALDLAYRVVAIELLCAAQGLDFRLPLSPARASWRRMRRCAGLFHISTRIARHRLTSRRWPMPSVMGCWIGSYQKRSLTRAQRSPHRLRPKWRLCCGAQRGTER